MRVLIAIIALGQLADEPTPLDAFRANFSAMKAELDYVLEAGRLNSALLVDDRIWSERATSLSGVQAGHEITGSWACDGTTMHFVGGSPEHVISEAMQKVGTAREAAHGGFVNLGFQPRTEALLDGQAFAQRVLRVGVGDDHMFGQTRSITVWTSATDMAPQARGPFSWWEYPFPHYLRVRFPDEKPRVVEGMRGGNRVVIEVYRKPVKAGFVQAEIAYDPIVGYLPRHTRLISFAPGAKTWVKETFFLGTALCGAGGFVPTEWYTARFSFDRFQAAFPAYSESTDLVPGERDVFSEHFRAVNFRNRASPVGMQNLEGVGDLAAAGGSVRLTGVRSSLTMAEIRARLGTKLTNPIVPPVPSIDEAELHEYDRTGNPYLAYLILGGLIALTIVLFVILRKRFGARAGFLLCMALPSTSLGCGKVGPAVIRISGGVEKPVFLVDGVAKTSTRWSASHRSIAT